MKKALLTALIMFATAFLLLFSFQKDKNRVNSSGKKIYTSEVKIILKPEYKFETTAGKSRAKKIQKAAADQEAVTVSFENETLETFFREMPRTHQLATASAEEIHGTPHAVLDAGEKLAEIHDYFFKFPQPRDVEMSFYLQCSQQKDFFDSVRAVCAARLSQHYFEGTGHQISSELFDKNIDQLRREISL